MAITADTSDHDAHWMARARSQAFAVFLPVKSVGVVYDVSGKPPATIEWE